MPRKPETFSEARSQLDQVVDAISSATNQFERGRVALQQSIVALTALGNASPDGFTGLLAYANEQAAANPTDDDWQRLASEVGKVVADFQAIKVSQQAKYDALNAA